MNTYETLLQLARRLQEQHRPALLAVDGRCAAGKTTLAQKLGEELGCNVFHTDDFFLPFSARTPQRLAIPGGHMDYERLLAEVLQPLQRGESVRLARYNCRTGALEPARETPFTNLSVVEGSYALHPLLRAYYACRVFLTVSHEVQKQRVTARNGEAGWPAFRDRWIPAEEAYFAACDVPAGADYVLDGEN